MAQPSKEFLADAIYLVDASSYIFRAYYAIAPNLNAPDGTPTHATFGFLQMLQSLLDQQKVKRCVLLWDQKEKGYRHEIYPDYKANRSEPPEDLGIQLENSKLGVDALGLKQLGSAGFEADDLIATMIHQHPEKNFVIVTSDKDLLQLIGPNVWCLDTMKNKWSHKAEAFEKFGVEPEQVPEVQALCGDSVDNVPGAPGVGPKTATQLLQYYKSLDAVLKTAVERHASGEKPTDKTDPLKGKKIEAIAENIEKIEISLKLVRLSYEAPVPVDLDPFVISTPKWEDLKAYCEKLGFSKLFEQVRRRAEANPQMTAPEITEAAPVKERFQCRLVKSLDEFKKILSAHEQATHLALDTETFGLESMGEGDLVGLSLAFDAQTGYYVPLRHQESALNLPIKETLAALNEWISTHPEARIIFQNAKFDLHIFKQEGLRIEGHRIDDTMVASFALDPSQRHGMDALSQKYLDYTCISFSEALGGLPNFSFLAGDAAARYAAEDAVVTFALWERLSQELVKDSKLWNVYRDIDAPLASLLFEMEEVGICLDLKTLEKLSNEFHKEVTQREKEAIEMLQAEIPELPPEFNLGSTKQLAKVLFEDLKLPILKKGKTGPSTDASVLEELANQHPFPYALMEIREINKLLSTYIDAFPRLVNKRTQRLHTDFSQIIAVTGRLSSSNPNLQNIPIRTERGRRIRDAFCAPQGSQLLGIDYSQVELRILAHMSGDKELVKAFKEGADIHKRTAALVLGVEEDKITSDDRRMAKAINFGIVYGQTPFGLAKSLGIDRVTAKKFIDDYFVTYPGIRGYMDEVLEEARRTESVKTLAGRVRYLPDIKSKNPTLRNFAERTAINSPIQGTAADLIKCAMHRIRAEVLPRYPSVKLVLQIHDELLFEVPDTVDAQTLEKDLKTCLEDPDIMKKYIGESLRVIMKTEAALGPHWGALK
jgi:DNA polymerase I